MILTFDNADGRGAQDYTAAIDRSEPLTITRKLNAPATLKAVLCLAGSSLTIPVRRARVVVTGEAAGTPLFTGYLTLEPSPVYAGEATTGPVHRLHLHAVSDDFLLDTSAGEQSSPGGLGQLSPVLLQTLAQAAGAGVFTTSGLAGGRALFVYSGAGAASWSTHAGSIAAAGYGAYRVLNGALTLAEMPGAVHTVTQDFTPARLQLAPVRTLVNDITLTAQPEPATTWTELFRGDGTTAIFALTGAPASLAADHAVLLSDDFTGSTLSHSSWRITDSGSHLSLGANGLVMNGGNGLDGQTTLTAAQALELGGSIVLELNSVMLNAASAGVLCGLYAGSTRLANCMAGFNVQQINGQTLLVPVIQSAAQPTSFVIEQGHRYTLRMRLFSTERLRFQQTYYTRVDGVVRSFGGGLVDADVRVVMEVRDLGDSSNTPVTILYDGVVSSAPAQANVVVLNSLQLFGSIGSVAIDRAGSLLVRSTDASTGTPVTRLIGQLNQGLDCAASTGSAGQNSTVTFFNGRIPAANELVTVQYQQHQTATARVADPVSIATEAGSGGPGNARLTAAVHSPVTRSSVDCENAAAALLAISTDRAAALAGSYTLVTPPGADILPGDLLNLPGEPSLLVHEVTITDAGAAPEALTYAVHCSNDWAAPVGIQLGKLPGNVAAANLPATALNLVPGAQPGDPAALPVHVLANLRQMSVMALSNSVLTLDAGTAPPAGGGFEVRRRDSGWGQTSADLVLESPVRGFDIPRLAFEERFFIRIYDASTPRLYSRFATAFVTHAAVG